MLLAKGFVYRWVPGALYSSYMYMYMYFRAFLRPRAYPRCIFIYKGNSNTLFACAVSGIFKLILASYITMHCVPQGAIRVSFRLLSVDLLYVRCSIGQKKIPNILRYIDL